MTRNFLDDLLPIRRILVDGEEQPFVADIDFDSDTFEVEVDEETGVLSVSGIAYPHGDQAGGSLHALAIAGGAAGFMSGSDKTKLDGITAANAAPPAIGSAGVVGVSTEYAREEHTHALGPGPFGPTDFDTITVNGGSAFHVADDGIGGFGSSVEAPVVNATTSVETPLVHNGVGAVGVDGSDGVELYHNGNQFATCDLSSSVSRVIGSGSSGTRIEAGNGAALELRGATGVSVSHATSPVCTFTLASNVSILRGQGSSGTDFAAGTSNVYLSAASASFSVFIRGGASNIIQASTAGNIAFVDLMGSTGNEIRGQGGPTLIRGVSGSYVGITEGSTEVVRVSDNATVSTISGQGAGGLAMQVSSTNRLAISASHNQLNATGNTLMCQDGVFSVANNAGSTSHLNTDIATGVTTVGASGATPVHRINGASATTVGSAGAASALPATPTGYLRMNINGTVRKIPYYDD